MLKLGCSDKINAILTYQVYIDLIEVKKFYDVTYHFSKTLNTMFITARESKSDVINIYIPTSSLDSISINRMEQLLKLAVDDSKT